MKRISLFACLLLLMTTFANASEDNWKIVKKSPFFSYSAEFRFQENEKDNGKIIRTGFLCPRYYYDLYDGQNNFEARGKTRFFSLGMFYPSLMNIGVYDRNGFIGSIKGKFWTRSRTKFTFSDAKGKKIAYAYLNAKSSDFLIVSSENEAQVIAHLKGETFGETGLLKMKFLNRSNNIDDRLFKIFCAYISDYHETFLEYLIVHDNTDNQTTY